MEKRALKAPKTGVAVQGWYKGEKIFLPPKSEGKFPGEPLDLQRRQGLLGPFFQYVYEQPV